MPPHSLTSFEIQQYYQNKPEFDSVYSRNNLLKIKVVIYIINLDQYKSKGTHYICLYVNGNNVPTLTALELKIFQKTTKKFIDNKTIKKKELQKTS